MNTTHQLTNYEQRGYLTVINFTLSEPVTTEGWFHLNSQGVIMRKIGGRNRHYFASLDTVIDFRLSTKETQS